MSDIVEITGLGTVSPLGNDVDSFWERLLNADSRPGDDPRIDPAWMPVRHNHRVVDAPRAAAGDADTYGGRAASYAVEATRQCLADAGLDVDALPDPGRIGCVLGSAMGGDMYESAAVREEAVSGLDAFPYTVSAAVAAAFGLCGPNICVSTACSAGLYSVALAADLIRRGEVDAVITGGAEDICRVAMGCFNRLQAMDPVACRPFDVARAGAVMGEGAAVLLLESGAHRRARQAGKVYGRVKGEGWSCDAHHTTNPEAEGLEALRAMETALARAKSAPQQIDVVLAHGTGTPQNDLVESRLLGKGLGSEAARVWVSGNKGKLGHTGGAAGAFQCLTAALAVQRRGVPPTGNVARQDPECSVRLALAPVDCDVRDVLMNSYAFGGNNISLIIGAA